MLRENWMRTVVVPGTSSSPGVGALKTTSTGGGGGGGGAGSSRSVVLTSVAAFSRVASIITRPAVRFTTPVTSSHWLVSILASTFRLNPRPRGRILTTHTAPSPFFTTKSY